MRVSEEKRVRVVSRRIRGDLTAIVQQFPSYDQLTPFYRRLFDIQIDKDKYKKSLGALSWVCRKIEALESDTHSKIKEQIPHASKHFLGKTSSIVTRVDGDLRYLMGVAKTLKSFPVIREEPTLVVAGYPNVGKSTFVRNLTGSKVAVAAYPFTTKGISIGHVKVRHAVHQIVDSPGILDRPMDSRNKIELQAVLALSDLADRILFIVDPTIGLDAQRSLLGEVADSFGAEVFVGLNKLDEVGSEALSIAEDRFKGFRQFKFSAFDKDDCMRVFREVFSD